MNRSCRNRWTTAQKLEILAHAENYGISNASKKFNISTVSIRNWRDPEAYQKKQKIKSSNQEYKDKNKERSLRRYKSHPAKMSLLAKQSRKRRRFKRLVEMSNRFFTKDEHLTAIDLWRIAKKQKLRCALTGEKLTNDNISVDHIRPKSLNGSNKPENIRLVHKDVNLARRALTDDEFLTLCKKVVSYLDPRL